MSRFGAEKRKQGVTEKVWKGRGWREGGGRERKGQWLRGVPEARRQGFGFEEGLLLSGTPDLPFPHHIEPEPELEHGS